MISSKNITNIVTYETPTCNQIHKLIQLHNAILNTRSGWRYIHIIITSIALYLLLIMNAVVHSLI